ncbi:MAG: PEP-CTERM sorting domain-containing protein [Phycisphaeraceae bacterium]|nr:PEP-CTERM sorting domain-containing protein [Phycisphaeraceae bacterium]MCB9848695.1 PEP-CTERM sorting domain-containing protein [Phycisphaeraceae bacterium]
MIRKSLVAGALVAGAVGLHASAPRADAVVLLFDFLGNLNNVPAALSGDFTPGDFFALSFVVDTNAPITGGSITSGPGFADYATSGFSSFCAGYSVSAPVGKIRITNDNIIDEYDAYPNSAVTTSGVPAGFSYLGTEVRFQDFSALTFPDTNLVTDTTVLMGMGGQYVMTFFNPAQGITYQAFGSFTDITATLVEPEPGAAALLGIAAIGASRRRRN